MLVYESLWSSNHQRGAADNAASQVIYWPCARTWHNLNCSSIVWNVLLCALHIYFILIMRSRINVISIIASSHDHHMQSHAICIPLHFGAGERSSDAYSLECIQLKSFIFVYASFVISRNAAAAAAAAPIVCTWLVDEMSKWKKKICKAKK